MVKYRYWEKDANLEEIQAKIWNFNNPDAGQPATAEQIKDRFEREKIDPKTVRYAFTEDEKPLAYVQARDYDRIKETHVGYPHALEGCPEEVQNYLFDEMLGYIKQREQSKEYAIRMNAGAKQEKFLNFFRAKGLKEVSRSYRYDINLETLGKVQNDTAFKIRKGTIDDLKILVDLIKADGRYLSQFPSDEDIEKYFTERVLPADHTILVFKNEILVQASAPLLFKIPGEDEERLILRFEGVRPGFEGAWKPLLLGVAKECLETDYGIDKGLSVFHGPQDSPEQIKITESFNPNKEITGYSFGISE